MVKAVKIECGISFRLRENTAASPTPITCFVEFNGKPVVKIPTGTKILPSKWNFDKERPIGGMKGLDSIESGSIMEKLSAVKTTVESNYREHVNRFKTYPNKETFKQQVLQSISGETDTPKPDDRPDLSLLNFFERQIKLSKDGKRLIIKGPRKGKPYRVNTIKSYEGTLALLKDYVGNRKLKALDFDDITMDFYHDVRSYMFQDRSFSLNYFGKAIKHIKLFMGEAEELKLHASTDYRSKAFIKVEEETDAIYLNIEQLEKIRALDLDGHPGLSNARDLFLLGAWTGLRFQDYSVLGKKAKVMGNMIHIETEKVGVYVAIPILPTTLEILERYRSENGDYEYPTAISNQKLNDYIKLVAKKAGLKHPVTLSVPEAGKRVHVTIPFHQAVDTHTARRSFATNMYKHYRLPALTIMKITGHTTEANFFKYIRMTPEENAEMIFEAVMTKTALEKVEP